MVERILEEVHGEEPMVGQTDSGVLRDKTNEDERKAAREAAQKNRRRKKTTASLVTATFQELYKLNGEMLGKGAYASVQTCVNTLTDMEFAVKIIEKIPSHSRSRVFREVETFHHCQNHPNIIQLLEMFEDDNKYYLVFEKVCGGPLLQRIQEKEKFTEKEAAEITRDLANALKFLHSKGIAHRDLKPENILCVSKTSLSPVKLCDFDLGSGVRFSATGLVTTPRLNSPVGTAEFMAPEVVHSFISDPRVISYDKMCDLWSLGVVLYILLCGYQPFWGSCARYRNGNRCREDCVECRMAIFDEILQGKISFEGKEWDGVSDLAKDLVLSLLCKDIDKRLTAEDVLQHSWLTQTLALETKENTLETPRIINRNGSANELSSMAESAMCLNRVVVQQISMCQQQATVTDDKNSLGPVTASSLLARRQTQAV